jgi:hypothetical protein
MAFLKRGILIEAEKDSQMEYFRNYYIVKELSKAEITIFLSHSHKDKDLAYGFENLLAQYKIKVYIDWQDYSLPDTPNRKTAERIKEKIKTSDFFILLATYNALSSRWCPWELGIADGVKSENSILIVPIISDSEKFEGNEYLQLYNRVEISSDEKLLVLKPEVKEYNITLQEFEIIRKYRNSSTLKEFIERRRKYLL